MKDDEIGKSMVVNKIVYEYCISEWYFCYTAKFIYYVLGLYYVIHKIVSIISLLNNNCE